MCLKRRKMHECVAIRPGTFKKKATKTKSVFKRCLPNKVMHLQLFACVVVCMFACIRGENW